MIAWLGRIFESNGSSPSDAAPLLDRIGRATGWPSAPSIGDPIGRLEAEVGRARRYEHSLSLVVLTTTPMLRSDPAESRDEGAVAIETSVPQMVALVVAAALREVLRESDVVCYQPARDRFLLALTESGERQAIGALRRVRTVFEERLKLEIHAGIARFPDDAYTRDGLAAVAIARAASDPVDLDDRTRLSRREASPPDSESRNGAGASKSASPPLAIEGVDLS